MSEKNGFTLLELLIVLSIWSIITTLSVPILFNQLEKIEEEQFLETFKHDVLYIQYLSTSAIDRRIQIRVNNNNYEIIDGSIKKSSPIIKRYFPKDWEVDMRTIKRISFNENGTIRYAGTISIKTKRANYFVVFPPGKGRCYIVEQ